jgi:hypothetical protein
MPRTIHHPGDSCAEVCTHENAWLIDGISIPLWAQGEHGVPRLCRYGRQGGIEKRVHEIVEGME